MSAVPVRFRASPSTSGNAASLHLASKPYQLDPATDEIPDSGQAATAVYQAIHDELKADGKPQLNLASFVTTWMDDEAQQLALESINKNLINAHEYPHTDAIHQRVVRMIARLFHADVQPGGSDWGEADQAGFLGTTTVGSSEAVMLALLAPKWNWKKQRKHNPKRSPHDQPYLIMATHTHACFAKFARYFDVGVKCVYLEPGQYAMTAAQVQAILETRIVDDPQVMAECGYSPEEAGERRVGELVMAIACVVGTTYTGDMDDVAGIDRVLTEGGWEIPIHVDAASGGFVLAFTEPEEGKPRHLWDFRLSHVQSINVSNHKYGLVYPGLGTVVFRNPSVVPEELLIDVDYLSGEMRNYSLNFSRPSQGVILQYYNFLHLGKAGYRRILHDCLQTARYVADALEEWPMLRPLFEVISQTRLFPVVVIQFKDTWSATSPFSLADLAEVLKARGWLVPVYHLPANAQQTEVMRIVIRSHFNQEMATLFLHDLEAAVQHLLHGADIPLGFVCEDEPALAA